jgi:hypothetical protein
VGAKQERFIYVSRCYISSLQWHYISTPSNTLGC